VIWFFEPGTERRVEVERITHRAEGDESVPLSLEQQLYILPCWNPGCGVNFTLRHEHGVTIGADGAITTDHSFNCPKCGAIHAQFRGGVVQLL
jgi:hypothetical protein